MAFALFPPGTLEGNCFAAWTYHCPRSIARAEWHGQQGLSLDSCMVWMLNTDSLGSVEYQAENHCGLQHQTELLRGGQVGREGHRPGQL